MNTETNTESTQVWGIDLGTTYSCISRVDEFGHAVVVNNSDGDPTTPSVVMFLGPDNIQVGKEAKRQKQMDPDSVVELVKRQMGTPDWGFEAHGQQWSAPEISAQILKALAEDAAQQSGDAVEKVVITVPAYFGIPERDATVAAGRMAGLEVVDVLNEPTAAALSYGFAQGSDVDETVLVYDLGGGTFDVTVIRLEPLESSGSHIRVVATGGDHRLGGADWDQRMVQLLASRFQEENSEAPDPLDDDLIAAELRLEAEEAKRALTARESITQVMKAGSVRAAVSITRVDFEQATQDLLESTIDFTRDTLEKARERGVEQIDRVLLVGGSSFMPAVKRRLEEAFPGWSPQLGDPNQAVAKGAALYGFQADLRSKIQDLEAQSAGNGAAGGADREAIEKQVAEQSGLALGALQRMTETKITNVCARGFGVMVVREGFTGENGDKKNPEEFFVDHLLRENDPLPIDRVNTYGTIIDNQASVEVVLFEQAGTVLSDELGHNKELERREFHLPGNDPRGTPIEVTIRMGNDGMLTVVARHPAVAELSFSAQSEHGVLTQEQIAESAAKVQAMRRV
jgi:molecular chaperone DnaK